MRQIALDTETTGLSHNAGDKILEIAAVELVDRRLTGNNFHRYVNPERTISRGALQVHGISADFLKDKPVFAQIAHELVDFIAGAELIIHNAPFDVGFINSELKQAKHAKILTDYCKIFDTLVYARTKHPGQRNSLDALCKRYNVNNSNRDLHGALIDAKILALIYLALTGGQFDLFDGTLNHDRYDELAMENITNHLTGSSYIIQPTEDEITQHEKML